MHTAQHSDEWVAGSGAGRHPEAPVFSGSDGRRARRLRWAGRVAAGLTALWLAALLAAALGVHGLSGVPPLSAAAPGPHAAHRSPADAAALSRAGRQALLAPVSARRLSPAGSPPARRHGPTWLSGRRPAAPGPGHRAPGGAGTGTVTSPQAPASGSPSRIAGIPPPTASGRGRGVRRRASPAAPSGHGAPPASAAHPPDAAAPPPSTAAPGRGNAHAYGLGKPR